MPCPVVRKIVQLNAASDMVVHPSLEDALSQILIESLMMTKPIVATDISGAGDTLGDGKYGKLVRPADANDLRNGIEEIMEDLDVAPVKAHFQQRNSTPEGLLARVGHIFWEA